MAVLFLDSPPAAIVQRPLTEDDAVAIWIARWLRVRPADIRRRYGCDPRRLYEIWEEVRFAGSRSRALDEFHNRYPGLDIPRETGPHKRIPLRATADQLDLFPTT